MEATRPSLSRNAEWRNATNGRGHTRSKDWTTWISGLESDADDDKLWEVGDRRKGTERVRER